MTATPEQIECFVAASRRMGGTYGLMRCSSGNLSWRFTDDQALVTASRSWMSDLQPEQVVTCRISDDEVLSGPRPSVETRFHMGILRARPEMNVVMHFQTPFATTLACSPRREVNFFVLPEIAFYIGSIGRVPFLMPGSPELADAVVESMTTNNMTILDNHGFVTVGKDFDDAIQKAVFFELACEVIVRGGGQVDTLTEEAIQALLPGTGAV